MRKLFNTANLIPIVLFLTPCYLIKFNIFQIPFNLLDVFILVTIILWLFENKNYPIEKIKKILIKNKLFFISIFLILIGLFISSLLNNNLLKELGIIRSWFILPILFGFILFDKTKKNHDFKRLFSTLFYSSSLISIISLFYLSFGNLTYDLRLRSFYLSPNHLAIILAYGLIIGLWQLIQKKMSDFLDATLILSIITALFFTHSYAIWVATLIVTSLLVYLSTQRNQRIILTFVLITICITFFTHENNSTKFEDLINFRERSSLSSRVIIWQSSIKIIKDNWLWGIGPGNFQEKYLEYQKYFPLYLEWAVPQPHNLFLAFWLQAGLVGIMGFLILIYTILYKIIKILIKNKDSSFRDISVALLSLLTLTLIYGLFDTPYWKNDLSLIFWTLTFLSLRLFNKGLKS